MEYSVRKEKEMNEEVELQMLNDPSDFLYPFVEQTYVDSFPEEERRDTALFKDLLWKESAFSLYVVLYQKEYAGFISSWHFDDFSFVEHFAIEPYARNCGIGAVAMRLFLARSLQPVFLEVELPREEMAIRRIGFYSRLLFESDPHPYYQPPYRNGETALEMRLMVYGVKEGGYSFEEVKQKLYEKVYGVFSSNALI